MQLRVRDARPEDAEALHHLTHAAYADRARRMRASVDAEASVGGPERPLTDTIDDVRANIREGLVLVAEDDRGAIVATVMLRRVVNVRRLAVAPEAKRAGLGGALLEAALRRAADDGAAWAMLDTIPDHAYLPEFYRKHGFEERCLETFPDGDEWLQFRKRLE